MSKKVSYYYHEQIGNFYYSQNHPMKPFRIKITDTLIEAYKMKEKMHNICPEHYEDIIEAIDFTKFHSDEYVDFLQTVNPQNLELMKEHLLYFNIGEDCPVFEGIWDYCCIYSTGSIIGAHLLSNNISQIAINWSGGLHHAKKNQASGFCYINDCVLAIVELLNVYERVLYIDIDIHHGDGVEEAFLLTDRVMTLSFHKYFEYFPGTGSIHDIGLERGKYHSVNVPLFEGINDDYYESIFKLVFDDVVEKFKPNAIVFQCGADSLFGDRLGCFNLTIKGHGACLAYAKKSKLPMLVLGGGGYTLRNVPRCWTYETSILLDTDLDMKIPSNEFSDYFHPEYKLITQASNMDNMNSINYLNSVLETIYSNNKKLTRYSGESTVESQCTKPSVLVEEKFDINEVIHNNPDVNFDKVI